MAVVISLKLVYTPVDDTVTAPHKSQVTSHNAETSDRHVMCTGRNLIARVPRTHLPYAENLVSGDLLGACGVRVRSGRSFVRGAQVRRGCVTGI